jgi:hypothetical protein
MPTVYVMPGRSVVANSCFYTPAFFPTDPVTNTPISPFGIGRRLPYAVTKPTTFTGGMAVTIDGPRKIARLIAAGFVSTTPTVLPIPAGPQSKVQNVVTSYVKLGTVKFSNLVDAPDSLSDLGTYTVGQQVLLPQSDTDQLTAIGILSPTRPPT